MNKNRHPKSISCNCLLIVQQRRLYEQQHRPISPNSGRLCSTSSLHLSAGTYHAQIFSQLCTPWIMSFSFITQSSSIYIQTLY